jgi:hypothetical protein
MLTLDRSTLFYWTLHSDLDSKKRKHDDGDGDDDEILRWANKIPSDAKPASRATSRRTPTSRSGRTTTRKSSSTLAKSIAATPSLTTGSSAPSVLTDNVRITSHVAEAPPPANAKAEPVDFGRSGDDETHGKAVRAKVCPSFFFHFHRYINAEL